VTTLFESLASIKKRLWLPSLLGGALLLSSAAANATIIYDSWLPEDGEVGNYIVTVTENTVTDQFDIVFTVDPWNAEALAFFVDLGDFDYALEPTIYNSDPLDAINLYAWDTTSNDCGNGCNLGGDVPIDLADPDGEWELVFNLGEPGFEGIQTFSWSIDTFGLTESDWGLVGVRAQVLCPGDFTLPEGSEYCGGSDKSVGTPVDDPETDPTVPVPGTLFLLGLGLLGLARSRRRS
jgi:hypothetical protein